MSDTATNPGTNVERLRCQKCGRPKLPNCDGNGWFEPLGPYRDGSYITSRPCSNDNPFYDY